ncbi:uncharacterized protein LOC108674314 [Hyalella azteca]|uniref:Uncharacterized protein LOC108674314 n=1 Tax=Hyalella azteca TaxID=294128 RepID=A0A8B7NVI5_HYAAZ|nr:uncharacterized protein LOC108674314 [Hyalella azteca]
MLTGLTEYLSGPVWTLFNNFSGSQNKEEQKKADMGELSICICIGLKKHMLMVREDTTVEELAYMIFLEVLEESPPSTEEPLCSLIRMLFRGRQLTTPSLTMGALRVKHGERIMVLLKNNHGYTAQKLSKSPEQNVHPAFRNLQQLKEEADRCEDKVRELSEDIDSVVPELEECRNKLKTKLKDVVACNEEHEKLLLKLDAIETEGDDDIRAERKALVVRLQKSLSALDSLSSSASKALHDQS